MIKNTYFVFSDIHGEYNGLRRELKKAGYDSTNPRHKLISCGDAFDRGEESSKVYEYLINNNAICVKGNHDCFLEEYLEKGLDGEYVLFNILRNGLHATIKSFAPNSFFENGENFSIGQYQTARQWIKTNRTRLLPWLKSLPLYYETKNYIFVHAGIDPRYTNWKDTPEDFMLWDIEHSHVILNNVGRKIVVFGHHHAAQVKERCEYEGKNYFTEPERWMSTKVYGNEDENSPIFIGNKIGIDGCTILTKTPNILVIEDEPLEEVVDNEEKEEGICNPSWININEQYATTSNLYTTTEGQTFTINLGDTLRMENVQWDERIIRED